MDSVCSYKIKGSVTGIVAKTGTVSNGGIIYAALTENIELECRDKLGNITFGSIGVYSRSDGYIYKLNNITK